MSTLPMSERHKQQERKRDKAASIWRYKAERTCSRETHTSPIILNAIVPLFDVNLGRARASAVFSPDGKNLVWASNRNAKAPHETNIFIADWVP